MANSGMIKFAVALTCLVAIVSSQAEAIGCNAVISTVAPCIKYISAPNGPIPVGCCDGAKALYNLARTTPDRQTACRCLKPLLNSIGGNTGVISSIAPKCGVNLGFTITPTIDCNSIH